MKTHSNATHPGRTGSTGLVVLAGGCLVAGLFTLLLANFAGRKPAEAASVVSIAGETADYATKRIEDVQAGDLVVSRDPETGEVTHKRVINAFRRTSDHLRILEVESPQNGLQRIETTNEHPFWVSGHGFVKARALQLGDELDDAHGAQGGVVVKNTLEVYPDGIAVCNFEVEDFHTYFVRAGGTRGSPLFVHNAACDGDFVADAGTFLDRVPPGHRTILDDVIGDSDLSIVLPKAIRSEISGASDVARLASAKSTVNAVRSSNVAGILRAHPDILSGKFGINDLKLLATAKRKGLPIVTTNSKLINQVQSHADRKRLFGSVRILIPGRDFSSAADLKALF